MGKSGQEDSRHLGPWDRCIGANRSTEDQDSISIFTPGLGMTGANEKKCPAGVVGTWGTDQNTLSIRKCPHLSLSDLYHPSLL